MIALAENLILLNYIIISQKVLQEDGQCCSPFIVAARFGHNRVVKMLLDKFKLDIEQEGRVKFDGYIIEGASALWCAAGEIFFILFNNLKLSNNKTMKNQTKY